MADNFEESDLRNFTYLTNSKILECLHSRFEQNKIYTWAGDNVLIAINPNHNIEYLYTEEQRKHVQQMCKEQYNLNPHVFTLAESCYQNMRLMTNSMLNASSNKQQQRNQAVIITGESGSGKTETVKLIMQYLTAKERYQSNKLSNIESITQKIMESNPILEAFGNASTCRNKNSSRFGKYLQICYDQDGMLQGIVVKTYLLEKTRILFLKEDSEESFHVFYQFLSSLNSATCDRLGLPTSLLPSCSTMGNDSESPGANSWATLVQALSRFGIEGKNLDHLCQLIGALLLLCRIDFKQVPSDEEDDEGAWLSPVDEESVVTASRLMGWTGSQENGLVSILRRCQFSASTGGGRARRATFYARLCSPREANTRRDALVKTIYNSLFEYLVGRINTDVHPVNTSSEIGILDIFGFECLPTNSFEQLCINYTNERLQQHFMTHFVRDVLAEYRSEKLDLVHLDLPSEFRGDNSQIMTLFDGMGGLFAVLNEECLLNRHRDKVKSQTQDNDSADASFIVRLGHVAPTKSALSEVSEVECQFTIRHFASPVRYSATAFIEKNLDRLPQDLADFIDRLVTSSTNTVMSSFSLTSFNSNDAEGSSSQQQNSDRDTGMESPSRTAQLWMNRERTAPRTPLKDINECSDMDHDPTTPKGTFNSQDYHPTTPKGTFNSQDYQPTTPRGTLNNQKRRNTVASWLKGSVDDLIRQFQDHDLSYVRCLRVNPSDTPVFSSSYVEKQLAASGIQEAVDMIKASFPASMVYSDFLARFRLLLSLYQPESQNKIAPNSLTPMNELFLNLDRHYRKQNSMPATPKTATPQSLRRKTGGSCVEHVLHQSAAIVFFCCHSRVHSEHCDPSTGCSLVFRMGRTRLYLTEEEWTTLTRLERLMKSAQVRKIQTLWHRWNHDKQTQAAIVIQSAFRMSRSRRQFQQLRIATISLQRWFRSWRTRLSRHTSKSHIVSFSDSITLISVSTESSFSSSPTCGTFSPSSDSTSSTIASPSVTFCRRDTSSSTKPSIMNPPDCSNRVTISMENIDRRETKCINPISNASSVAFEKNVVNNSPFVAMKMTLRIHVHSYEQMVSLRERPSLRGGRSQRVFRWGRPDPLQYLMPYIRTQPHLQFVRGLTDCLN